MPPSATCLSKLNLSLQEGLLLQQQTAANNHINNNNSITNPVVIIESPNKINVIGTDQLDVTGAGKFNESMASGDNKIWENTSLSRSSWNGGCNDNDLSPVHRRWSDQRQLTLVTYFLFIFKTI